MTIEEARKDVTNQIMSVYDKSEADNITEIVMEHITRWSRPERILNKDIPISVPQQNTLSQIIQRLLIHEPIQYIINEVCFAGMIFYVDRNVLIPRPETEELIEWVVADNKSAESGKKIIDIGSGSGCIAITLKNKLPGFEMWSCDISNEALNVARMNADALNATVDFVSLNFLDKEQRRQLPNVDIIVSNPPYIPESGRKEMKKNVLEFEPANALFVSDDDPLIFYKAIADFASTNLAPNGSIYVEIHESLGEKVQSLFNSRGFASVELRKDLQGKERMIKATS